MASNLRNSPVGSSMPSFLPLLRIQFRASSKSLATCSGLRRDGGTEPSLSKAGMSSKSAGAVPLLRNQSKAPSISRARSSGDCPRFIGSMASNLRNSPVGSSMPSFLPLLRIQFRASSKSLATCSGLRRDGGTEPSLSKAGLLESASCTIPLFLIHAKTLAMFSAASFGVRFPDAGIDASILRKTPVGSSTSSSLPLFLIQFVIFARSAFRCFRSCLINAILLRSSSEGISSA